MHALTMHAFNSLIIEYADGYKDHLTKLTFEMELQIYTVYLKAMHFHCYYSGASKSILNLRLYFIFYFFIYKTSCSYKDA